MSLLYHVLLCFISTFILDLFLLLLCDPILNRLEIVENVEDIITKKNHMEFYNGYRVIGNPMDVS
jgi:hypothetical protein